MFLMAFIASVVCGLCTYGLSRTTKDEDTKGNVIAWGAAATVVVFLFGWGILAAVGNERFNETEVRWETEGTLYSIRNGGQEISGRFFLGCGTINSQEYYFAFESIGNGLKRIKFPAEDTVIYEVAGTPHYDRAYSHRLKPETFWEKRFYFGDRPPRALYYWRVYVPVGTVVEQFVLE